MNLREFVFVFAAEDGRQVFHRWVGAYFAGALDGSGSQLLPNRRVKVRGLYAQEVLMFAREADKLGGVVELQPQDLTPVEAQEPRAPSVVRG